VQAACGVLAALHVPLSTWVPCTAPRAVLVELLLTPGMYLRGALVTESLTQGPPLIGVTSARLTMWLPCDLQGMMTGQILAGQDPSQVSECDTLCTCCYTVPGLNR
jgi:hypothetical protein